jgi:chemotaxis protein methyltransferase CheR
MAGVARGGRSASALSGETISLADRSHRWSSRTAPSRLPAAGWGAQSITDREFQEIKAWIHKVAGINLSNQKKALVMGRLAARLRHFQLRTYGDYFRLLHSGAHPFELQTAIDLLTTNETHFFREPKHFDFLREKSASGRFPRRELRVWSAATSSGEEAYSIAMTLAATLANAPWEVFASDLSSRALERARAGHYSLARAKSIPRQLLQAYCLKGVGAQAGTFLVEPQLRSRVQCAQINLVNTPPPIGEFEFIFLRNVMIYFDVPTKREVVARVLRHLRPGGYMIVGHAETLSGVTDGLQTVMPSIYRKL